MLDPNALRLVENGRYKELSFRRRDCFLLPTHIFSEPAFMTAPKPPISTLEALPKWLRTPAHIAAMGVFLSADGTQKSTEHSAVAALRERGGCDARVAREAWQGVLHERSTRKGQGAFYTPEGEARVIAQALVGGLREPPRQMLEPTCGGGVLLVSLVEALCERFGLPATAIAPTIHAVELDPIGLALARWSFEERFGAEAAQRVRWECADALGLDESASYDLVFANPPFGNAIEKATQRSSAELRTLKSAFPLAARGAFDRSALFVEKVHRITAPDASIALILPTSFLAQPAAAALRKEIGECRRLWGIQTLSSSAFIGASVSTSALLFGTPSVDSNVSFVITKGDQAERKDLVESGNWSPLIHPLTHAFDELKPPTAALGDYVEINAGAATDEAYQWKPFISEAADVVGNGAAERQLPLVIAGTIEPFESLWSKEPTRYLGETYRAPVILLSALNERRQAMAQTPRVLVAGLSRALEGWLDASGASVGAVSTLNVVPTSAGFPLPILCAIINSAWLRVHYASVWGALALSGGNIQVTRQKLASVPTPQRWWSPPEGLRGRRHAEIDAKLADLDLGLTKVLPSTEAIETLLRERDKLGAGDAREPHRLSLWEHLLALAEDDAQAANRRGWLDLLLLALA